MKAGLAIVHIISPGSRPSAADHAVLTESEKERAAAFKFPEMSARWTGYRAAMRRILAGATGMPPGDVPVSLTGLGKPVLDPPFDRLHFSLSHCDDLALLAVCGDGDTGVDLEPASRAPDLAGCEATFCHPDETAALPAESGERHRILLEIWTAKEALLKALGTGFTHPPESTRIHFGPVFSTASSGKPLPGIEGQVLHRLCHPALAGHVAFLSAPASVGRVEIVRHESSTSGDDSCIMRPSSIRSDG